MPYNKCRLHLPASLGWTRQTCGSTRRSCGRYLAAALLLCASFAAAQEDTIPYPTELGDLASISESRIYELKQMGVIATDVASANVMSILIETPDKRRVEGIRLVLSTKTTTEQLYIDQNEASQLSTELYSIATTSTCHAKNRCVLGVARCRPSRTQTQALCVGHYNTPAGEAGLLLSTPTDNFLFPSVKPTSLATILENK